MQSRRGEIASLLISALSPAEGERALVYKKVIAEIDRIVGGRDTRPLSQTGLKLQGIAGDFSTEARVRSGATGGRVFASARLRARALSFAGRVLMSFGVRAGGFDGGKYKKEVIENSDFRKFDETLRMVLDLTTSELQAVVALLEREHNQGHIAFGLHRSPSALVTCFVRSYAGDHLHFVDGADGGYALAASQLKAQLGGRKTGIRAIR